MDPILCIDATSPTVKAIVLKIHGRSVEVLERYTAELGDVFAYDHMAPLPAADTDIASTNGNMHGQENQDAPAVKPPEPSEAGLETGPSAAQQGILTPLLSQVRSSWVNAVLIIPSYNYLSLNIELPFSDYKNINKIIDLEVQDVVPFDISEFLLQPRHVSNLGPERHDIHVSLMPRRYLQNVLNICRRSSLDPYIVSTPASVLGGLYHLAPQYLSQNSAILFRQGKRCHILICIDGCVRSDRVIDTSAPFAELSQEDKRGFLGELRLTLSSAEKRYGKRLERVYALGDGTDVSELQFFLARDVERLRIPELIQSARDNEELASLGAVFAQDIGAPLPLTNFRVREFAYRPQVYELLRGLRTLLPFAVATLMATFFALGATYLSRERRYNALQNFVETEVSAIVPSYLPGTGTPIQFLESERAKLEQQLTGLGSQSKFTPVDALIALSKDISPQIDASVSKVTVEGSKITISGSAESYSTVEKIERSLKREKSIYKRVTASPSGARPYGLKANQVGFSFEIHLEE